ncbi:MAG: branched-chain amino acid ABC transporter permease [Ilumatobacteraceae bacterium]
MSQVRGSRGGYLALLIFLALLVTLPTFGSRFFVEFVVTRALILGLVASTIVFLSAYGGMVSLAQLLAYGVAGFVIGNCVPDSNNKGLKLGLGPWVAVALALIITTIVALVLGALSSRTFGIYFLMLTLTYAVIGYYVFGQVATISGFGGITGLDPPSLFDGPLRLYYLALALSVLVYIAFRATRRTPFGVALEGIRDDPVRMASLGFHVPLHRALAFTLAGFVAAIAGVLNVWWNGQIDPNTVSIGETIDLLIVAVIGGIGRLEGAWLGAIVYVAANNYLRDLPGADSIGLTEARFNTVVGLLVLAIVVLSPDGLMGLVDRARNAVQKRRRPGTSAASPGNALQDALPNTS